MWYLESELSGLDGGYVATGAGADDGEIVFVRVCGIGARAEGGNQNTRVFRLRKANRVDLAKRRQTVSFPRT